MKRCVPEFPAIPARPGALVLYFCTFFATSQLLWGPSKQARARGGRWAQARGAGLSGNLRGVSGVLPRLLGRSVLVAKMGMVLRNRWSKSSQAPPSPVSLPTVLRRGCLIARKLRADASGIWRRGCLGVGGRAAAV